MNLKSFSLTLKVNKNIIEKVKMKNNSNSTQLKQFSYFILHIYIIQKI